MIRSYYCSGLIFNGGNGGNCLRCPWSLPWCPFKSPNRNLQIPHRGALCQGQIALPLQVRSIRPDCYCCINDLVIFSSSLTRTPIPCPFVPLNHSCIIITLIQLKVACKTFPAQVEYSLKVQCVVLIEYLFNKEKV